MSQPKSSISALQELCAQRKVDFPDYIVIPHEEGFACKIEVMGIEEYGIGRSKRDAKHTAAANALKRLKATDASVDMRAIEIQEYEDFIDSEPLPPVDAVALLRDYCVQNDHPLPKFELVCQYGTPNAPRFTMSCQVATIVRHRTSDNKKDAKQKAAFQMFLVMRDNSNPIEKEMEIVSTNSKINSMEEDRVRLFKTYRQLIDSGESVETFGTPLFERHNALKKFNENLKKAAFDILNKEHYSAKSQVDDVLFALKLNSKVDKIPSVSGQEMIYLELDCPGLDICFAGYEDKIYEEILQYFRDMLK